MRKLKSWGLVCLVCCFMGASFFLGLGLRRVEAENAARQPDFELFFEVLDLLENEYVEPVSSSTKLIYGAIQGMLVSLDDAFTRFMDPSEYKIMQGETKGEFGGIGISISIDKKTGRLVVVAPMKDTPAANAGIKGGAWIQKIDGKNTAGIALDVAVSLIRGEVGTKVVITILQKGEKKPRDVELTRAVIKLVIAEGKLLDGNIGYVRLSQFSENSSGKLKKEMTRLQEKGVKGLILDLRENPGGLLDAAIEVTNLFIKSGTIVQIVGRRAKAPQVISADESEFFTDLPLVVLVDSNSASASEIVAGALQDLGRAVLVGEKTFGKGSVQTVHPLRDGSAIAITTAKYLTSKGRDINKHGIDPDVAVKGLTGEELNKVPEGKEPPDPQLDKAMQILKEKISKKYKIAA